MTVRDDLKARLLQPGFAVSQSITQAKDPIVETPMIVTLDKLRPSPLNPRFLENPKHAEIKESIKASGLKQPPPITRIPDEEFYIISDGGNTRLQILNELWKETSDRRFFEIHCVFKPWVSEIHSLVGHLSENEMRGDYAFIEKALGVVKAKEMYERARIEQGIHKELSVRDLSELLKKDGYPVSKGMIGKMQQTVDYLLPCLEQVLYKGLGRPQIEKLLSLRANAKRIWEQYCSAVNVPTGLFTGQFEQTLSDFNQPDIELNYDIVEETVIGMLCRSLSLEYNLVRLEFESGKPVEKHQVPLSIITPPVVEDLPPVKSPKPSQPSQPVETLAQKENTLLASTNTLIQHTVDEDADTVNSDIHCDINAIFETSPDTQQSDEAPFDFDAGGITSVLDKSTICTTKSPDLLAQQPEDLEPINDIWRIDAVFDHLDSLSGKFGMAFRLAVDIANQCGLLKHLQPDETRPLSFTVKPYAGQGSTNYEHEVWSLLNMIANLDDALLKGEFSSALLLNAPDAVMIKILRLIRVVRRVYELRGGNRS